MKKNNVESALITLLCLVMISGFSGILCSYLVPFFALSKPAPLSCSVLRFLIVIISRRYILSSPMSMPLSQRHHCHCHGSHHEQYHRFHRHCHHQGRSGPLPLCLLLCNFHQNKQNIKVCCLRTDENHWKQKFSVSYNLLNQFEDLTSALISFQHSTSSKNAMNVLFLADL